MTTKLKVLSCYKVKLFASEGSGLARRGGYGEEVWIPLDAQGGPEVYVIAPDMAVVAERFSGALSIEEIGVGYDLQDPGWGP